jgi:hypothetical protein
VVPSAPVLLVPEVSSERREYVPMGWMKPPAIPSNLVRVLEGAAPWHFGILTSRMHMVWLREIGGRLEGRYRYSIGIVYNAFPWPEASARQRRAIGALAQNVLEVRARFRGACLAELYAPTTMKPELRRAHRRLDAAVDRLYRAAGFDNDRQRVEHLFGCYEKLVRPAP